MIEKATVEFELNSSFENWTKFTSPKVEVAGFEWFASGEYFGCGATTHVGYDYNLNECNFVLRNTVIHCSVVGGEETSIWSCEANGEIAASASNVRKTTETKTTMRMTHSKLWSHHFTFGNPQSAAMEIDFHKVFFKETAFYLGIDGKRMYCKLELLVNVTSHSKIDLCAPDNEKLKSSEDAAKVVVEGKRLWLSKEILGGASPFFKAYFDNDFIEKQTGEFPLSDAKVVEFMRYVAIVYGVHVDIDKTSLMYLLRLEDIYECEIVRSKCYAFLIDTGTLTHAEKLRLGERYRFPDVISTAIENIDIKELRAIGRQVQLQTYSHKTAFSILKRLGRS